MGGGVLRYVGWFGNVIHPPPHPAHASRHHRSQSMNIMQTPMDLEANCTFSIAYGVCALYKLNTGIH